MFRKGLTLGASVLVLSLVCGSYAQAQQTLPTIDVGSQTRNRSNRPRVAAPRTDTVQPTTTQADRNQDQYRRSRRRH